MEVYTKKCVITGIKGKQYKLQLIIKDNKAP